jgi:hypothetical protein
MPDEPQIPQSKTGKLVESSLIFGIGSIAFGITALPAIIQSIRALVSMRKEHASKANYIKVFLSLFFSSCCLGFIVFSVTSAFSAAQGMADQINCIDHMKELGLAIRIYSQDNGDILPPARWCDAIVTNSIKSLGTNYNIPKSLHCPTTPKQQACGYAMNLYLVGKNYDQFPNDTVMLFESDAGWNAVGGPEIAARHHFCMNVVFVDGSADEIPFEKFGNLRWNPDTNAPAK